MGIKRIGVIDNGEGSGWPHGPFGNLHLLVYHKKDLPPNFNYLRPSREYSAYRQNIVIPGPSPNYWTTPLTVNPLYPNSMEFCDGDFISFGDPFPVWDWMKVSNYRGQGIIIAIYESDPGREHDPLFCCNMVGPARKKSGSQGYTRPNKYPPHQDAVTNIKKFNKVGYVNSWLAGMTLNKSPRKALYIDFCNFPTGRNGVDWGQGWMSSETLKAKIESELQNDRVPLDIEGRGVFPLAPDYRATFTPKINNCKYQYCIGMEQNLFLDRCNQLFKQGYRMSRHQVTTLSKITLHSATWIKIPGGLSYEHFIY